MMSSFLCEVAEDLYSRYGSEVGELKILFPSRRGRIFFTDAISQIATQPIWESEWVSIDEMMSRISGVEVGEHIRLITELFKIYRSHHKKETFDRFYYWGETLLSDFDMVDKYMIDADQIFRNISDIKELETDTSYLTPQQLQIIAFWSSVGDSKSGEDLSLHKERFLVVWRSLLPIYEEYRERLTQLKIAYPGMVHRLAAERIMAGEEISTDSDRYVIAGFNALSECERVLFDEIKRASTTHFYWDWDDYYSESKRQEAGLFLERNRLRYPAAKEITHDNFSKAKNFEVVACSSTALQCRYVANIIEEIIKRDGCVDKRTAIVLTDESLLLPLLYSLPEGVGKVNVTMGYPLKQSLAYSFIERLLELQSHARKSKQSGEESFYHINVVGLLSHPYLATGVNEELLRSIEKRIDQERLISVAAPLLHQSELLTTIFTVTDSWQERSEYLARVVKAVAALPFAVGEEAELRVEFLSYILDHIIQLHHSIAECDIELMTPTYVSLLRRHLQPLRIPFEGEPLEGLQVMGILETRALDFENVILLSMNDDNFPGGNTMQPSFIPYTLRAAYELPTPEHHDGVYAYYFYRLIQRAKEIKMLYCSRADDKSTGEQSRYITQLEMESPFEIERMDVGVDVNLFNAPTIEIEKRGSVARRLRHFCSEQEVVDQSGVSRMEISRLSPTALFQYIACPLRFYYKSIARIRTEDELTEEVDSPMFGNILHDSMQQLYKDIVEKNIVGEGAVKKQLEQITTEQVVSVVDTAIRKKYLMSEATSEELSGNLMLIREVVVKYITGGVLRYDIENPPERIIGVEKEVEHFINLSNNQRVRFMGICDRIDQMADGSLRIVDYKTGTSHLEFAGVERLFTGEGRDRQSNIFQTLLYSYMLRLDEQQKLRSVTPSLYYVRSMNDPQYSPLLCDKSDKGTALTAYETLHEAFDEQLRTTLTELFDESIPFSACDDILTCKYCDFLSICHRDK